MSLRIRLSALAALAWFAPLPARAVDLDGTPPAVGDAEAQRLYNDANDYVANVTEGQYSYAYIQFHWKRAESFVERAARVYPDSPTGRALKSGQLKLGPFAPDYFRDRVLARLEEKKNDALDPVNCAIFLYERDRQRTDPAHLAAFEDIIEVMSRQARWGEVRGFPAQGVLHTALLKVMFREAARSRDDQQEVITQLLARTAAGEQAAARFQPSQAEALVLLGAPRADLAAYLAKHPENPVKLAVLQAMVDREVEIRRRTVLKLLAGDRIETMHYVLERLQVRDDVEAAARQLWPAGSLPAGARETLGVYHAALGERPAAEAPLRAHLAYLEYLGAFEKFDELESYPDAAHLGGRDRSAAALKLVELYARAGRPADVDRWSAPFRSAGDAAADAASLAEFRGRLDSTANPLIVRPQTFAALPIHDPCVLAQAIMEWSLTPERSIRGASAWDAVVLKYLPGFENLPLPKSEAVRAAASSVNPY